MTRDELLSAAKLKTEEIEINGKKITVTELCAEDYLDALNQSKKDDNEFDGAAFNSLMVCRCVLNDDGNRMFSDEDALLLRKGSFSIYRKLVEAANRVNGLSGDETKN